MTPAQRVEQRRRIVCCTCGKQVVSGAIPRRDDTHVTKAEGSKAGFGDSVFCGYCAEELDADGLFPGAAGM